MSFYATEAAFDEVDDASRRTPRRERKAPERLGFEDEMVAGLDSQGDSLHALHNKLASRNGIDMSSANAQMRSEEQEAATQAVGAATSLGKGKKGKGSPRKSPRKSPKGKGGRGKGKRGLGMGGAKRHRTVLRDNVLGITKPAIRRLCRRGGIKRISAHVYEEARGTCKAFMEKILRDAVTIVEGTRRKTVRPLDVVMALKRHDMPLYGYGA